MNVSERSSRILRSKVIKVFTSTFWSCEHSRSVKRGKEGIYKEDGKSVGIDDDGGKNAAGAITIVVVVGRQTVFLRCHLDNFSPTRWPPNFLSGEGGKQEACVVGIVPSPPPLYALAIGSPPRFPSLMARAETSALSLARARAWATTPDDGRELAIEILVTTVLRWRRRRPLFFGRRGGGGPCFPPPSSTPTSSWEDALLWQ